MKKICITSIGIISSDAIGIDAFWKRINSGDRLIPTVVMDTSKYFSDKDLYNVDKNSQFAAIAARNALEETSLNLKDINPADTGVSLGTSLSIATSMSIFDESVHKFGPRRCEIGIFPNTVMCAPASRVSIFEQIKGMNSTISTGDNSGVDAVGYAFLSIFNGDRKIILAGGCEAASENISFALNQINPSRKALVIDGACVFVIEDTEFRSPNIKYCNILGFCAGGSFRKESLTRDVDRVVLSSLKIAKCDISQIDGILLNCSEEIFLNDLSNYLKELLCGKQLQRPIFSFRDIIGDSYGVSSAYGLAILIGILKGSISANTLNKQMLNNVFFTKKAGRLMLLGVDLSGQISAMIIGENND